MKISVSGKHMNVGDALRTHVEERLNAGISKYLDRATGADVVIAKGASHQFRCDIMINTGTHSGITAKASAEAGDVYAAFDLTADKVEKQLRRYKRRLTDHHKNRDAEAEITDLFSAKQYVIASDHEKEAEEGSPLVIAEQATNIQTLSVSEAVMRMDLEELPVIVFCNRANGRLNVLYRRADGNISWLDPEQQGQVAA